jgi:hypothetical protein
MVTATRLLSRGCDVTISPTTLDTLQQRLFAVVLRLRVLRLDTENDRARRELGRLEREVDALIKVLRSHAAGPRARD